ncbi:Na+/H+ antiporter [Mycobacterium sp. CBMA271]|uniref:Na+/H+ antiporter n=1 Tax=unclassified Mycobacteroides TaxID=2618759 RepID=UPI0013220134|nr:MULTISPECIES: Na+/H+ antiporter [unclassified Mycobacteroides]MUM15411.1 Na+/H+ antiporter [Mycobacteroides sp. CBMA 326]MUM21313.1 Na+/H+ antiporter [Mycobacteroides sp. CBMA 271]
MNVSLLAVLTAALVLAAISRRFGLPAPLVLVVAGLAATAIPGLPPIEMDPDLVLFVILPPLLYTTALESSYVNLRKNIRAVSGLAVLLPLLTTVAVGFVAFYTVPELPLAGAMVLGAIVAPPDAVSATAIGRRLGLPRNIMTLLGGESLLNDATALTAYRVAIAAAVGLGATVTDGLRVFALAAVGGVFVGFVIGKVVNIIRCKLDDPLAESAIGLVVPFFAYLLAEEIHGSGVIAVVVAGLMLGHRSSRAGYATRLQDDAVWRAVQLLLESFAFLLIGLQLPAVIQGLRGLSFQTIVLSSIAVLITVIVVRILFVFAFAYLRPPGQRPSARGVFVVAWAGMRGVVSLAMAFAVPLTTLSGEPLPGHPHIVFLTFVVVVGTLLLHGLTLPWVIRVLGVQSDDERKDALAEAAAQDKAARAAADRLEALLDDNDGIEDTNVRSRAAEILRHWNTRRRNAAWERLGRSDEDAGESPMAAFRNLRLEMLDTEREVFIAERDAGNIDDEVLRTVLRGLDLEEATMKQADR